MKSGVSSPMPRASVSLVAVEREGAPRGANETYN
jgi:hypothetical protein